MPVPKSPEEVQTIAKQALKGVGKIGQGKKKKKGKNYSKDAIQIARIMAMNKARGM